MAPHPPSRLSEGRTPDYPRNFWKGIRSPRGRQAGSRLPQPARSEDTITGPGSAKTVDELLAQARGTLPYRPSPAEALRAQARGALLIDIRGDDQRRDGLIPGALVIPRNCLEWRCDPASRWRHPAISRRDLRIILVCHEGYQSSLAAATLHQFGLIHVTDLDGGFTAWTAAGLPVITGRQPSSPPRRPRSAGGKSGASRLGRRAPIA